MPDVPSTANPAPASDPNYADAIVQTVREPLLVLDAELRVRRVSESFYNIFKVAPDQTIGRLVYELGDGQWNIPALRKLLEEILPQNSEFNDYHVEHNFPGIGPRTMLLNARRLQENHRTNLILLAIEDVTDRRKAELEVSRQHAWFRTTLSSIGDAVIATDTQAHVSFLNPTAEKLTGWTASDAQGKPLHEVFNIVNEKTRHLVESPVSKAIRMGSIVGLANHTMLIAKDGTERPIDDSAAPIRDEAGNVVGVVMVFHDITERRKAEREVAQLAAIVESSDDAIISKDLDGIITSWNRGAAQLFGYSSGEAIGQPVTMLIPPDRVDEEPEILARIRRGERVDHYETVRRRKDGTLLDISLTVSPLRDRQGRIIGASKVARDITERRKAAEALKTSEIRYRRLFEAAHDGILLLDVKTRRITDVNPFMLDLLDYPREHFIGKEMWEIGIFRDKAESQRMMQELHEKGTLRYENKPLVNRNGRRVPVEIVANIYQEDHEPVIQANIRDISERERFESEREAHLINEQSLRMEAEGANRAKDVFLATLSHELRTPLNAIVGWVEILRREGCNDEDFHEGLGVIDHSVKAQTQLIDDVLDVSRIVSGKLRLDIQRCDLKEVIEAAIESVRAAADAREIRLETQLDPDACAGSCDSGRIQQVVWNLLSNAIKFTPRGGRVAVGLDRQRSMTRITVSDTGQGIAADFLPYVFERFRQADSSTRRKFGGLGLGLSIVKQLVELHGGTIEAGSEGDGRGATFTVRLPIKAVTPPAETEALTAATDEDRASAGARTPASSSVPVRLDGLRIVVVDDEPDARRVLTRLLADSGAVVTSAGNVPDALAAIAKTRPHVLVSDLAMPDEDGYDLIRQVRARGLDARELPAVALTAFAHKGYARSALLAGFQVHIPKPVDPHDLLATVASLAGRTGNPPDA